MFSVTPQFLAALRRMADKDAAARGEAPTVLGGSVTPTSPTYEEELRQRRAYGKRLLGQVRQLAISDSEFSMQLAEVVAHLASEDKRFSSRLRCRPKPGIRGRPLLWTPGANRQLTATYSIFRERGLSHDEACMLIAENRYFGVVSTRSISNQLRKARLAMAPSMTDDAAEA